MFQYRCCCSLTCPCHVHPCGYPSSGHGLYRLFSYLLLVNERNKVLVENDASVWILEVAYSDGDDGSLAVLSICSARETRKLPLDETERKHVDE